MQRHLFVGAVTAIGLTLTLPPTMKLGVAVASEGGQEYTVSVTNLTRGQQFTPILAVTHTSQIGLFSLGAPASPELARLAEEGNTGPLSMLLTASGRALDVQTIDGLLGPGETRTFTVRARGHFRRLSLAAMLIPTNDAFFAVNGVQLPSDRRSLVLHRPAYDSGSERNDELCASIPGPSFAECGGPGGGMVVGGGESYVFVHAGIHGIGNLIASERDWRNPVVRIAVRRAD